MIHWSAARERETTDSSSSSSMLPTTTSAPGRQHHHHPILPATYCLFRDVLPIDTVSAKVQSVNLARIEALPAQN